MLSRIEKRLALRAARAQGLPVPVAKWEMKRFLRGSFRIDDILPSNIMSSLESQSNGSCNATSHFQNPHTLAKTHIVAKTRAPPFAPVVQLAIRVLDAWPPTNSLKPSKNLTCGMGFWRLALCFSAPRVSSTHTCTDGREHQPLTYAHSKTQQRQHALPNSRSLTPSSFSQGAPNCCTPDTCRKRPSERLKTRGTTAQEGRA